jgi:ABC-type multidrug transport system fused ATPase/permease subunit
MELLNINQLLMDYIKNNKVIFIAYILITVLLYPIQYIGIPDYYGMVINSFKDKSNNNFSYYIKILLLFYILAWLLESIVMYVQYHIVPSFSEYATGSIFNFVLDHYELDFENIHTGEILGKIIRIPNILFEYIDIIRVEFLKELFVLFTAVYKYFSVSNAAAFLYLFYVVINYTFIYFMFKIFSEYNIKTHELQDKMYECLVDCFNNLSSVYSFNQKENEMNRFYNVSFKDYKKNVKDNWMTFIRGDLFWGIVTVSLFVSMNYVVYKAYLDKKINSEKLVSMFIITFSIIRLYEKSESSAKAMASVYGQIKDSETFFNEISEYNRNENKTNKGVFKNGHIRFKGIYHKYNDEFVLENINLDIKQGEKVALVGQIGSGKSTLIKLLLGFQPIVMGEITIADQNINDIPNVEIRENLFYIPQKPKLFNRPLYDNIVYGLDKPPSREDIIKLLNDLELVDIAKTFEEKMDDDCGVDGNSLSGGQRQIVWLLRSFYRKSRILVLDEPTASLDPDNKKLMIQIIKRISPGKTVIIVSHDDIDPTFRKIEMKKGRLVRSTYFD